MEKRDINIGIKKIKEIEFFVNEEISIENNQANIKFELTMNLNMNDKTIEMILTVFFSDMKLEEVFMRIKTSNIFNVIELPDLFDAVNNTWNIPDDIIITLLSLSVSHTRALHAKNVLGTKFSELYIPIVNPTLLHKQLFGKI